MRDNGWKLIQLMRLLQGMAIGAGAILPGVSGGMLCALFGIYGPLMALAAEPRRALRRYGRLLLPVVLGGLLGFFALSSAVERLFTADAPAAVCLFLGLTAGSFPSLWLEAGRYGRSSGDAATFIVSFIAALWGLLLLDRGQSLALRADAAGFFLSGILWGLSLVLPGLSSSTLLIYAGLYQPMTAGISSVGNYAARLAAALISGRELPPADMIQWQCILPLLLGAGITVLLAARLVNSLLMRWYSGMHHLILGVLLASALTVLPTGMKSAAHGAACLLWALSGFGGAAALNHFLSREDGGQERSL